MRAIVIYDDTGRKSEVIADIIGDKGFADVVVKRRKIEDYLKDEISKVYPNLIWFRVNSTFEYSKLLKELDIYNDGDYKVLHWFANYIVSDSKSALLSIKKLEYIDERYGVMNQKHSVGAMFSNVSDYCLFVKNIIAGQKAWDIIRNLDESFEIDGVVDLGNITNFIQCITGNFDSRYFNSLKETEYTLTKSSTNKAKIKAEYTYYQLLPDDMKYWFVMPFDYKEEEDRASYTMERLYMTDLAIKWVHGSMDQNEFEALLDRYFHFFEIRHVKECSKSEYESKASELYDKKVRSRIEELKRLPEYFKIESILKALGTYNLDDLVEKYFELKSKIEKKNDYPCKLVIGHGDPCFANALYNKSTKTLKFIDPKGALTEEELWTNPYYDVAKLSHSICGCYDFFNNALFDIKIDSNFEVSLELPYKNDDYKEIFRRKANENGFDYLSIRIYEASLFLSMLPLHIDNPHKVLGFIINVNDILKEISENV